MTTLTERLRELQASKPPFDFSSEELTYLLLAEELHALLVECGEIARFYADEDCDGYDVHVTNYGLSTENGNVINDSGKKAQALFTKLQQAGIA
jgi:hypothetical protein